jgi:carotenoid cleavage dioxygenase-like enzyme
MEDLLKQAKGGMSRRSFAQMVMGACALGLLDRSGVAAILPETKQGMAWLAVQAPSAEGIWNNLRIEGKLPPELTGTLFRTSSGQTENNGTRLKHLFDGDAYVSAWTFGDGRAGLQARFINTPQRIEELQAKTMLYGEYGTPAPRRAANVQPPKYKGKNQPSVNVIRWRDKLLGLSEGGLPTVINPNTLAYEGEWDFQNSVPANSTFTAHPRFCPRTGDGYAWGSGKGAAGVMRVFRLDAKSGAAETLYTLSLGGFYMVHDAMLTENYFVMIVPPTRYDLGALMTGKGGSIGEVLRYYENEPARAYIFPRDNKNGTAQPIVVEMPSHLVFHHGNAYETADGKIVFETVWSNPKHVLETLGRWKSERLIPSSSFTKLRQVTIDLSKQAITNVSDIADEVEFPRFNSNLNGRKSRFLYAAENGFFENSAIVRFDLQKMSAKKFFAGKNRTFGEPVFVPSRTENEDGLILTQGYDAARNESFLEVRDADTLEFAARVWANGQHLPLGLHGNFYKS